VSVRDRGHGIDKNDRKRVFERFYRTQHSGNTRGSGIGLAIVKRIAEEHHGRVWATTHEAGGAVVGFTIPRRDPTLVTRAPADASATAIDSVPTADIVARDG
jgi:signal transduction histidine kinase